MDNTRIVRFYPDRRYTVLAGVGALLAAVAALLADDAPGRLLLLLAAGLLTAYALTDLVFSPRLAVSAGGVAINSPFARTRLGWDEIESIRADTVQRYGVRSTALEIDAGAVLAVLSRRSLGADPAEAAALAESFRPASPRRGAHPHHDDDEDEHRA